MRTLSGNDYPAVKLIVSLFVPAFILLLAFRSHAVALDPPHDSGFGAGCLTCHDMGAFDQLNLIPINGFVPGPTIDDTLYNYICWGCHNDTIAPMVDTHSSRQSSNRYGDWTVECHVCHNQHTQEQPGEKFIRTKVNLAKITGLSKTGIKNVEFISGTDFADGDATYNGICEVCHTQTAYHQNTASGNHAHFPGQNCITCHNHSGGFIHGGGGGGTNCGTCHNSNKHPAHLDIGITCTACHDLDNMRDGSDVIIDPRLGSVCEVCHQDGRGGAPNQSDYTANWDNASYDLSCDGCHNGRPNIDTLVMSNDGHERLVGEAGIRQYACYYCHDDTVDPSWNLLSKHTNGAKDVVVDEQWEIVDQDPPAMPAYDSGTQVCTNTYCHTDGTTVDPEMWPYPWSGGPQSCNSCHGHDPALTDCTSCHTGGKTWESEQEWLSAMPMYANTGPGTNRANSHYRHLFTGFSCDDCHVDTVVGGCLTCHADADGNPTIPVGAMGDVAHVNGTYHVNKGKTVTFKDGGEYNLGTKTCSSTACHSNGTDPVWGDSVNSAVTCLECHGTEGPDVDDFGVFNDLQARINMTQWSSTGHGRTDASGSYDSGNPAAGFPGIGCWYCHDNEILHQNDDNPFRLRQHEHFQNRFQKECVYCHMIGEDTECLSCHDSSDSLAPQLDIDIPADLTPLPDYNNNSRPDHTGFSATVPVGGCAATDCHTSDATRHKTEAGLWTRDQKEDVENNYVQMGVCLKCHDDDSGGQCNSCHTAPVDDPGTPDVDESLKYSTGFDPRLPGTTFIKPQQAKASSVHFGYKHYIGYENSIVTSLDSGTVSSNSTSSIELTDTGKSWTDNQWTGYWVQMTDGVSNDESRRIKNNSATELVLEKGFTSPVQAGEQYKIIDPVWKGGKFCWDCHDPHGDDNLYMIQNKVATRTDGIYGRPVTRADVVFTNNSTGAGYAKFNAPFNGICNVCHTEGSQHYAADRGDGHNNGRRCTTCHEHRFTDSHSSSKPCNSCHQNKPVPRHAGFGLPRDCTKCHGDVIEMRMNIMGQMTSKSHHVQGVTVTNQHCYKCHWEATENGLINIDHHEGYNYKNHDSAANAKVDLVIWTADDEPGVAGITDTDPTVGERPTVYDPDGTEPDGPGVPTVTQFLASNISGQGLAAQRGEVDKVTIHCLGCHSDQNNDAIPFDDCKTPRQYAWDRSSIGSRYSNTDTTIWGKYTGPNVAEKNIIKAFSAHGNAVNNGGGFHVADGEDKTITNTRDGLGGTRNYNVQCFDCHSSHGSKAEGTTSSYTTFNGTQNGGNLKETQKSKGGYVDTYFASENENQASVNPYKTGAGQCFDCHENMSVGIPVTVETKTPWGYNETFGATAPILGYKDTLEFGQSSRDREGIYPFKKTTITGGHFKASSALGTPAMGTIGGLCTPCHDPHGVSKKLGDKMEYGVPLLKGTWMTSPYKEDVPGTLGDGYGGNDYYRNRQRSTGYPKPPQQRSDGRPPGAWRTDRNTFNTTDLSVRTGGPKDYERIVEEPETFAGLCLRCHPKDSLTNDVSVAATKDLAWGEKERIHRSVKGWGWDDGDEEREHSFTCSKCHQPHVSALPRLMRTNCLNFPHRGQQASGGAPSTYSSNYFGRFPFGWWSKGEIPQGSTGICHGADTANGAGNWPDNQSWNNITPW